MSKLWERLQARVNPEKSEEEKAVGGSVPCPGTATKTPQKGRNLLKEMEGQVRVSIWSGGRARLNLLIGHEMVYYCGFMRFHAQGHPLGGTDGLLHVHWAVALFTFGACHATHGRAMAWNWGGIPALVL